MLIILHNYLNVNVLKIFTNYLDSCYNIYMERKKIVLITGASKGIGAQIAKTFSNNNYTVIVNYKKSEKEANNLIKQIISTGNSAFSYKADVSNYKQVFTMISNIIKDFGHIDVLVNNAGVCSYKILIDEDENSIANQINTNLVGTILCSHFVSKQMIKQNFGTIINISSIWGMCGSAGESVYSATKGGIISFTKSLAKELAFSGIRVNSIAPGVVETNMINNLNQEEKEQLKTQIPLQRFASPEEIAKIALFLASENSEYITGQVFVVDGGLTL